MTSYSDCATQVAPFHRAVTAVTASQAEPGSGPIWLHQDRRPGVRSDSPADSDLYTRLSDSDAGEPALVTNTVPEKRDHRKL